MESIGWLAISVGMLATLVTGQIDPYGRLAIPAIMVATAAVGAAVGALGCRRLMWAAIFMFSATPIVIALLKILTMINALN